MAGANLLERLLAGELSAVCCEPDGRLSIDAPTPSAIIAGSFNPLHAGHVCLFQVACQLCSAPAGFEISVANVDKPFLELDEIRQRLHQFAWRYPVWITRAATFAEKTQIFPGATFVIGADTAERLLALRYYANDLSCMRTAFAQMRKNQSRFLVAGRMFRENRFLSLSDLAVPSEIADLFAEIPRELCDCPTSSTLLRSRG